MPWIHDAARRTALDTTDDLVLYEGTGGNVFRSDGQPFKVSAAVLASAMASDTSFVSRYTPQQEVHQNFRIAADGDLTVSDDGGPWLVAYPSSKPLSKPIITSGYMHNDGYSVAGQSAAGYSSRALAGNVRRMWMTFGCGPYSTGAGGGALVIWTTQMPADRSVIPDAAMHLSFSTSGWQLGWWETGVGVHNYATGTFTTPLVGDYTQYRIEAFVDGNTVTVLLPNGQVITATDSNVSGRAGVFASWEVFRTNSDTDSKMHIYEIGGSSSPSQVAASPLSVETWSRAVAVAVAANPPVMVETTDTTDLVLAASPGNDLPGLLIACTAGPSGSVLIDVEYNVVHASGVLVTRLAVNGVGTFQRNTLTTAFSGRIRCRFVHIPGSTASVSYQARAHSTGVTTVKLSAASAFQGSMVATPV